MRIIDRRRTAARHDGLSSFGGCSVSRGSEMGHGRGQEVARSGRKMRDEWDRPPEGEVRP